MPDDHPGPTDLELAHERIVAAGQVAALDDVSLARRRERVEGDPGLRTWGLCERLLNEIHVRGRAGFPEEGVELAELAVALSERLDVARYGDDRVVRMRWRTRAELGDALRAAARFEEAAQALAEARRLLPPPAVDPCDITRQGLFEASLAIDLGRWDEAVGMLDEVVADCRRHGVRHRLARALLLRAIPLGHQEPRAAAELAAEAEELVDRRERPRLFLEARHQRVSALLEAGDGEAALRLFEEHRGLCREFPDDAMQLRHRWLEARIALALGHLEAAEASMSHLWSAMFEGRRRLDLALLTLDLTAVHVAQGEMEHAWRTAGRFVSLLQAWGVHRHALAAWLQLQRAFAAKSATAELIRETGLYLRQAWGNPELAFAPAVRH